MLLLLDQVEHSLKRTVLVPVVHQTEYHLEAVVQDAQ